MYRCNVGGNALHFQAQQQQQIATTFGRYCQHFIYIKHEWTVKYTDRMFESKQMNELNKKLISKDYVTRTKLGYYFE